jgi:hypothetical protein
MKTLIIQTSPPHTASTVLINALHGLIPGFYDKPIFYDEFNADESLILIKRHLDIDELIEKYSLEYKLYFIASERKNRDIFIYDRYKTYPNVIVFDFDELNETNSNPLPTIVHTIYNKIHKLLPFELDKIKCLERLKTMNIRYDKIKNEPFSYIDEFYGLHGSHRNRAQ